MIYYFSYHIFNIWPIVNDKIAPFFTFIYSLSDETSRLINNGLGTKKGIRLSSKMKSKLYNSPLRETE